MVPYAHIGCFPNWDSLISGGPNWCEFDLPDSELTEREDIPNWNMGHVYEGRNNKRHRLEGRWTGPDSERAINSPTPISTPDIKEPVFHS